MKMTAAAGVSFEETESIETQFKAFVQSSPQPQIILGTRSPSRRAIVDELACRYNFKYSVIAADIDEQAIRREEPMELVRVLAHAKAGAIMAKLRNSNALTTAGYLVTCDQVCTCFTMICFPFVDQLKKNLSSTGLKYLC
jgi:hypothetical protein